MRNWMVNPKHMCRKHLLGEHVECHMLAGCAEKKKSLTGYAAKQIIEPLSLENRHNELAAEIIRRGYNHLSPLQQPDFNYLPHKVRHTIVDRIASYLELIYRCPLCKKISEDELSRK